MKNFLVSLLLVLTFVTNGGSEESLLNLNKSLKIKRLAFVIGGITTTRYLGFKYVEKTWYAGKSTNRIRWINDWGGETYLNMDKGGHFMSGFFSAHTLGQAYSWAGFGQRSSAVLGTITSWSALLEIEMRDAYFQQWGFSIPDFTANTLGASIPIMYAFWPETRILNFKFSYYPSDLLRNSNKRKITDQPHINHVIDDYEGMSFWLSVPMNVLTPKQIHKNIPEWIRLALGIGASGLHGSNVKSRGRFKHYKNLPDAQPEILIGIDYDINKLPGSNPLIKTLKNQLNWIKFPAPAIEIYPTFKFHLLYM